MGNKLMSFKDNENELEYKKRVIDTKSSSWCAAKWYNATIWLGSGMTTSCHHPPAHKVSVEDVVKNPKALHNTEQKKQDRHQMMNGERPPGCEYCWKIEDMGKDSISDRVYKTVIYDDYDLDKAYLVGAETDVNLKTLEISFDRTCNFACSYCNPAFSTTWVKDIKKNGSYGGLQSDGRNHFTHTHDSAQLFKFKDTNPYAEAFMQWWESDLHRTLQELRITGGEPLLSGYTWQLFDWFNENKGKSNTRLAINSNLGINRKEVDRLLRATQNVDLDLYTSNESMGSHAEYIRDGLEWDQWIGNLEYLLEGKQLRGLHCMCTINALCLESLDEFLDLILHYKTIYGKEAINFSLNILRFPSFQSALVLPDNIRQAKGDKLKTWFDKNSSSEFLHEMEINQLQRLIDYLDIVKTPHSESFELPKLRNDFKKFFEQYDERRGKNFGETFPDLKEWYESL